MVLVGTRFDFGVGFFRPIRSGEITGNVLPPGYPNVNGAYDANGKRNFFIPELGYNRLLKPSLSLGVSLFGNGGMNTTYLTPIPLLGNKPAGVDLQQLFAAPTLAYKLNSRNAFGISLNIAYQRFKAEGLQNFASPAYSIDPGHVTNNGYDSSFGAGVRVGWIGQVHRGVSLGATFQTKTYASSFGKYRGLFAEQGAFDIPANFAGGVALTPQRNVTVLFDVERTLYGEVKSIANSGSNQALLRAGCNHSSVPFDNTQTFFNLLAPAVVQSHFTAGATWKLRGGKEINAAYIHAFGETVYGKSSIPPGAGGGNANLSMHQDSVGLSFGWSRE
jgi:long-chain fatty acid transport protein